MFIRKITEGDDDVFVCYNCRKKYSSWRVPHAEAEAATCCTEYSVKWDAVSGQLVLIRRAYSDMFKAALMHGWNPLAAWR